MISAASLQANTSKYSRLTGKQLGQAIVAYLQEKIDESTRNFAL
jgi:hypothetical protein